MLLFIFIMPVFYHVSPDDMNRVCLAESPCADTDYINASHVQV